MAEKEPFYRQPLVTMRLKEVKRLEGIYTTAIDTSLAKYYGVVEHDTDEGETEEILTLAVPDSKPPLTVSINRSTEIGTGRQQRFAMLYEGKDSETPVATYISDSNGIGVVRQMPDRSTEVAFTEKWGQEIGDIPLSVSGEVTNGLWLGKFEVRALAMVIKAGRA